ncbi:ATP-grasp domain-containing protein [Natronococcus sp. JC468]|uniref:carboxylate--amine ligase n=1 Tax=Natronococcus sp. JC468 TaxID=1961921 RepID=UPI00143A3358|nr:ATP-grasp domain-containing protein [Natronococcus sp. JC468]NKE36553.1 ATP-grasp domain-containing protein [Natronococcus sp. JC468]
MTQKKALVLDGRTLSSLAVVRSLGQKEYTVHSGESFKWNLTRFSKYVDKHFSYPPAEDEPKHFVNTLLNVVKQADYDVVIPTRDRTTELLAKHQDRFQEYTNLYLAEADVISTFMDKGETIKLAREADVPTPPTYFPEETDLETIKDEIEYPALVRARRSSGSRGIVRTESDEELEDAYETVQEEYETPMIQEYIEKTGYTTACILLDDNQEQVASFSYERIKEYPLTGGPTVVGVSTDDAEAKEAATKLLQEGSWKGVAEVEFILDQDGTPRLLEVNPRFWMPVHLAVKSGVDFPYLISEIAMGNNIEYDESYNRQLTYRWVLPNEILWFLSSDSMNLPIKNMFESNTCYGVLSASDPFPIVGTFVQSLFFLLDDEKRAMVLNRGS